MLPSIGLLWNHTHQNSTGEEEVTVVIYKCVKTTLNFINLIWFESQLLLQDEVLLR